MITIINQVNGSKRRFRDYRALYDYIETRQGTKRSREPKLLPDEWVFTHHSWRRVAAFYEFVARHREKDGKTPGNKNKRFDVLEISCNRSKHPVLLPITPDVDIEIYRKDWCQRYCLYHGFKLIEIIEDDGVLHIQKTGNPDLAPHDGAGGEPTQMA